MKIIFFGTGRFGIPSLNALKKSKHSLELVVTSPDKPKGRDLRVQGSPVKDWALENQAPLQQFSSLKTSEALETLRRVQADVFVVIAYGFLLPKTLLDLPKIAPLNVHSSLLPHYRGSAPIHWAMLNGDAQTGVTIMRMAETLDTGDILKQKRINISNEDSFNSLEEKLALLGAEALLEALTVLEEGKAKWLAQDPAQATLARKITKEDGKIIWNEPAGKIQRQIQALSAWPKASTVYQGKRLILLEAESMSGNPAKAKPGTVLFADASWGLVIACGQNVLKVHKIQAEGKKPLATQEFLKGFPISPGASFE